MNRASDSSPADAKTMAKSFPHVVIRASAGSGKTFQLSNRYLRLLASGVAPDQILATTFTRKAAGEILDRILYRLAEAACDESAARELRKFLQVPDLNSQTCRQLLRRTIRQMHRLRIATLDSFFAQIAGSHSLEFGLPPGWRITDERDDDLLRDEAIEAVLSRDSVQDLLTLVHLLTKGESNRGVHELVRATVDSLYELYRQTDKQAWEKIPHPQPLKDVELEAVIEDLRTTQLPNDKRFESARDKDFQNALADDWDQFIAKGLANKVLKGETQYYRKTIPPHAVAVYQRLLNHARAVLVGQIARQTEATYKLLERFDAEYRRLKHQRRALRFDDVTHCLAGNVLQDNVGQLSFRIDGGVSHLLLDEFQDTSLAQWQVLRPFARRVTSEKRSSFFCVGDVKQAIYGWRGGIAEIFDALPRELDGLTNDALSTSYRSSPAVIETVNRIFQGIDQHGNLDKLAEPIRHWLTRFVDHQTQKQDLPGYVRMLTAPLVGKGENQQDAVLQYTAEKIAELARRAPEKTIGVLVRRNATVGKLIYLLRKLEIDASEEGGNPLTDSAAVELILSLLRLADHPGDSAARFHLAHSPLGKSLEFTDHCDDSAAEQLARRVRRRLLTEGYGPVVFDWARSLATDCDKREAGRLQQLVELAYQYQHQATTRCDDFVSLAQSQCVSSPSSAGVRVMTVHQAKGLEFDVVVLPELDVLLQGQRGAFVAGRPSPTEPVETVCRDTNENVRQLLPDSIEQLFEEERRQSLAEALSVLYVSVTRPIHALYMVLAPSRGNEQKLPKSFAGLLRAALTDGKPLPEKAIVYECGERNWIEQCGGGEELSKTAAPEELPRVELAPQKQARGRGLEQASPSGLEGGRRVRLDNIFQKPDKSTALLRGTLVHAWFEQVRWLEDGPPDNEQLRRVAEDILNEHPGDVLNVDEQLAGFKGMLTAPTTARVLSRAAFKSPEELGFSAEVTAELQSSALREEVHNERRFSIRDGDQLLSGSIDRLVLLYEGDRLLAADIIDFKTDAVPDAAALADRTAYYRPQLEAYRRAVAKMTGLAEQRIAARLLFVERGELVSV